MIEAHDRAGGPAFELYALGLEHKHVPEIELFAGLSRRPMFMPSVGHFRQGMLVSVPLYLDDLPGRPTGADLREVLRAFYEGSRTRNRRGRQQGGQARTGRRSTGPTGSISTSAPMRRVAKPCSSRVSTISAREPRARRCRICG